jgi:hypothetical protein
VYERQKEPLDLFAFHTFLRVAPEWSPTILEIKKKYAPSKTCLFPTQINPPSSQWLKYLASWSRKTAILAITKQ